MRYNWIRHKVKWSMSEPELLQLNEDNREWAQGLQSAMLQDIERMRYREWAEDAWDRVNFN